MLTGQNPLIDWSQKSQEPLNGLQWNLVHHFLLGPRRSLQNGFDKLNQVRYPDPLNTFICKVLQYSLKNNNALSNFILMGTIFN